MNATEKVQNELNAFIVYRPVDQSARLMDTDMKMDKKLYTRGRLINRRTNKVKHCLKE